MSSFPFFYITSYDGSGQIELDENNSRHMVAVLRMKEAEQVQLTDGKGLLLTASIQSAHKKKAVLAVTDRRLYAPSAPRVTIAISPIKNSSRFEWFLEKASEIGVSAIVPLLCQRTEKQQFRYDRMQQILISALLQSQQAWMPLLHQSTPFASFVETPGTGRKWIAHCMDAHRQSLRGVASAEHDQILLIGPEGDFSPAEVDLAVAQGFQPVLLGATRLRTETAGIVGASLLRVF